MSKIKINRGSIFISKNLDEALGRRGIMLLAHSGILIEGEIISLCKNVIRFVITSRPIKNKKLRVITVGRAPNLLFISHYSKNLEIL